MRICLNCDKALGRESWACAGCGYAPGGREACVDFTGGDSPSGYDAAIYADQLQAAVEKNFWYVSRSRLIIWMFERYFPSASSFFEIGCGAGYALAEIGKAFSKLELHASDALYEGLAAVKGRVPGAKLYQIDGERIPFENEFDVAGAFDVFEHIKDDVAALKALKRAIKPGGGAIITVPQHPFLWSGADEYARHERRYTRRGLVEKVMAAGFSVERVTSFVSLLLPAMLAARLGAGKKKDYDPMAEFRISDTLNDAFMAVMDAERAMIRAGVSFPAGGSLLAVIRKGSS